MLLSRVEQVELDNLLTKRSTDYGPFKKLASGMESNFYFDVRTTALNPLGARLIGRGISRVLRLRQYDDIHFIGGMETGAIALATAGAMTQQQNGAQGFYIRKALKEHGTKKRIEGLAKFETMEGQNVIILEDVATTGKSAYEAIEVVQAAGGIVVAVAVVVDRQDGAEEFFRGKGIPFHSLSKAEDLLPYGFERITRWPQAA